MGKAVDNAAEERGSQNRSWSQIKLNQEMMKGRRWDVRWKVK